MINFTWNAEYMNFSIAILWSVVGFASYYFLSKSDSLSRLIGKRLGGDIRVIMVVLQRLWGLLFTGAIPVVIVLIIFKGSLKDHGLGFGFNHPPPWWSLLIILLIILAGFFTSSAPGNQKLYPQIRVNKWTPGILILSSVTWIIFLVAYEFLFRGFLLYATLTVIEPLPAIAINCTLYAFAHFYKGPGETFGALPLGILLCYLTLQTGNIWSAVVIHSVMALSNEWFSIRANPEMELTGKR